MRLQLGLFICFLIYFAIYFIVQPHALSNDTCNLCMMRCFYKYVIYIFLSELFFNGSEHMQNGSNCIDLLLHFGQSTTDRYWPYIKSTIYDWFLFRNPSHCYAATMASGLPS